MNLNNGRSISNSDSASASRRERDDLRPDGPAVRSPGREAGEIGCDNHERRRCGTAGVPVLRTSDYAVSESPPSRAGLFTAWPSALDKTTHTKTLQTSESPATIQTRPESLIGVRCLLHHN